MVGSLVVAYGAGVAIIVLAVRVFTRGSSGHTRHRRGLHTAAVRSLLIAARRRALIALVSAAATLAVIFALATVVQSWQGRVIFLAPALAGTVGLAVYAATPPHVSPVDERAVRQAALERRSLWSAVPRGWAWVFAGSLSAVVALLVFTGATASRGYGTADRQVSFVAGNMTSANSVYVGWFYAVPMLLATAMLVVALVFALRRVSSTPALPRAELTHLDDAWRRLTNRVLLTSGAATLLIEFGLVAIPSGLALRNAAYRLGGGEVRLDASLPFELVAAESTWTGIGVGIIVAGLFASVASMALVTLSASWAAWLPHDAARLAEKSGREPTALAVGAAR